MILIGKFVKTFTKTGSSGNKTNENANLEMNDGKKIILLIIGHVIQSAYQKNFYKTQKVKNKKLILHITK